MQHALGLTDDAATRLDVAGGKGANLARLAQNGFPVPGGFVVTTEAFRAHTGRPALREQIDALDDLDANDTEALKGSAAALREAIEARAVPEAVQRAVADVLDKSARYAVRSSATAEDLPDASFAGQHETFLNVRGAEAVLEKTKACMASLFTDRAVAYRARNGIPHGDVAMAVVVQEMAGAEAAGVLFTADPQSGNRRVAAVEAVRGLGEALVSGQANADRARIDRRSGTVLSYETAEENGERVLTDAQAKQLARLGDEIETLFDGVPQDIEWALAGGAFSVLQARPVTALPPLPEPPPADERLHVYLDLGPMQAISEPMPPLVRDFWDSYMSGAMEMLGARRLAEQWTAEAGGRVYMNVTPFLRLCLLRGRFVSGIAEVSEPAAEGLEALLTRRPEAFEGGGGARMLLDALRSDATVMVKRVPQMAAGFFKAFAGPPRDLDAEKAFYEDWGRRMAAQIPASRDPAERVRRTFSMEWMTDVLMEAYPRAMSLFAAFAAGAWLERLFPDAPEDVNAVGSGFPKDLVTHLNQRLGDVADVARARPAVAEALRAERPLDEVYAAEGGDAFREAFEGYLDEFGHRATGEIDISNPRWREDPSGLLQIIRANLLHEEAGVHREHLRELVKKGEAAARRLEARAGRGPFGFLKQPLARRLIRTYRGYLPTREYPKQGGGHFFTAWRENFLYAAERLMDAGKLERTEDLWFLRSGELLAALERDAPLPPQREIDARKAQHARDKERPMPPVLTSEGENPVALLEKEGLPEGALGGTGASGGVVEGVARVVRDPSASSVEPGDILVAPSCDPGWTPLFLNAAALVTEVGGRISHGALVAREYGLPAVVSVAGATRQIQTGQRIRVDGTRGVVEVLEDGGLNADR